VGIGTSTPNTKLTVAGTVSASSHVYVSGDINLDTGQSLVTNGTTNSKVQMNSGQVRLFGNHVSYADITIGNGGGTGGVIINEGGRDQDFRVEGESDTHLLFVDAGNDKVAIGTNTVSDSLLTVDGDISFTELHGTIDGGTF